MDDRLVTVRRWRRCCADCGVIIDKGEQVYSGPYFGDGRADRWWMHPICHEVAEADDWYGFDEDDRPSLQETPPDLLVEPLRSRWIAHLARRKVAP